MKNLIKKCIVWQLGVLAWMYLRRFKPMIVAVTGNVGKTSTKEAIATVLSSVKKVRASKGNLNNEFGVPLTILGDWSDEYYEEGSGPFFWSKVLWVSIFKLLSDKDYPEVLVLEYGADAPGDIRRLCRKFKPHISVITAVGDVPVHVEFFQSPKKLAKEKAELVKCLNTDDHAVLNYDDEAVFEMKEKTKARVHTYGFGEGADLRLSNFDLRWDDDSPRSSESGAGGKPIGISFKFNKGEHTYVPVKINGSLGKSQAWAAGAAAVVGSIFGMNLLQISEALADYHGPNGRLKILKGIKDSIIIDDTYNASPASTHLALETLKEFNGRKIAVLGDMLELGEFTEAAHREVGNFAASFVDVLVCVGARMKFAADSAANQMPSDNIYAFDTSDLANKKVQDLIQPGDIILVKGSQGIRMEKIVEEIMADPENRKELLVRQSKKWLNK